MAENTHTTPALASRHTLLATLGLDGLPEISGAEACPDAELIRLGASLEANHAEVEVLEAACSLDEPEVVARLTALLEARHDMAERLAGLGATTLEGLRAKAIALLGCARLDRDGDDDWRNLDEVLGWSLARDLVRDEVAERNPG
jgi:hypothetical protein